MAKKKPTSNSRVIQTIQKMNQTFGNLMGDTRFNTTGDTPARATELEKINSDIDNILHKEFADMGEFAGKNVSTFLYKILNDHERAKGNSIKSAEDIFTSQDGQAIIQFFYERYKNRNLLYEDLNMVSEQLFQLNEAIMATRDAIVTSDDMSKVVSRQLNFKNDAIDANQKQTYIASVENLEKEHKLLLKLKDHVIPKTLTYGNFFVYTVPYAKLFENFKKAKDKEIANSTRVSKTHESASTPHKKPSVNTEAVTESGIRLVDESFVAEFKTKYNISGIDTKKVVNEVNEYLGNIQIIKESTGIPVVEGVDISALVDHVSEDEGIAKIFKEVHKKASPKKKQTTFADGTVDIKSADSDFSNVEGCFVKTLDPKKVIPIKIMDVVLGYYYLHEAPMQVKTSFTTNITIGPTSSKMFSSGPEQLEHQFLSKITDRVIASFDKKFLENNAQFKELIFNCLQYNDLYKKQIKFEYIPVDYITEFKINEDENGNGVSVLYRSLFYAKLYLSILIFKMITMITRSTDTRIYYIKNSGFDQDVTNQLQQTARSIKEKQINFMDLMSYQSIVSKVGHMKDIFLPTGRSGERGIEFDILAGQDVQMNTDFMDGLERSAINSTGVPSVMMNYINEADYAKTLVMANAKFLGRVINHQMSINDAATELYKKVLSFGSNIPKDIIKVFEFSFTPPKSLSNTTTSDLINTSDQIVNYMMDAITGKNSGGGDDDNLIKDEVYKKIVKDVLPMLPWNSVEEALKETKLNLPKIKAERKAMLGDDAET